MIKIGNIISIELKDFDKTYKVRDYFPTKLIREFKGFNKTHKLKSKTELKDLPDEAMEELQEIIIRGLVVEPKIDFDSYDTDAMEVNDLFMAIFEKIDMSKINEKRYDDLKKKLLKQ